MQKTTTLGPFDGVFERLTRMKTPPTVEVQAISTPSDENGNVEGLFEEIKEPQVHHDKHHGHHDHHDHHVHHVKGTEDLHKAALVSEVAVVESIEAADGDRFVEAMPHFKKHGDHFHLDKRASRRSSSIMSVSRRSRRSTTVVSESVVKAESHFFALIEFMASASKEASSLREFWSTITSERETIIEERDMYYERWTLLLEEIESYKHKHHHHERELAEKIRIIEKLTLSLQTAQVTEIAEKARYAELEEKVKHMRHEIHESESRYKKVESEKEVLITEKKSLEHKVEKVKEEHEHKHNEKHEHHVRNIIREKEAITVKLDEMTSKYESSQHEIKSLKQRLTSIESEKTSFMHRCDKLTIEEKRLLVQIEELSKEILIITEKFERANRDCHRHSETIIIIEKEKSDLNVLIEELRLELKLIKAEKERIELLLSESTIHCDHLKHEIHSHKETIKMLEVERTELTVKIAKLREESRTLIAERDELKEELHVSKRKIDETHTRISHYEKEVSSYEEKITKLEVEKKSLVEKVDHEKRKSEEHFHKHSEKEFSEFKSQISILETQIASITEVRDSLQIELRELRVTVEEYESSVVILQGDITELEIEIDELKISLREATDQRERAIASRNTADRERDEYIAKYEEKCRQLEERMHVHEHAHEHSHKHGHHHHGHGSVIDRISSIRGRTLSSRTASTATRSRVMSVESESVTEEISS